MFKPEHKPELTLFDVTNLVVGAIIGADIYVASSFRAGYLGPSSLLAWVAAGILAIIIALCFAQCATLLPKLVVHTHILKKHGEHSQDSLLAGHFGLLNGYP